LTSFPPSEYHKSLECPAANTVDVENRITARLYVNR